MTTCELILNPITRMVEQEKKSLDEIAEAVCPKVEYGREKIIRIIKDFLGEEYLIQHADILKYDVEMAKLAKKRNHKKQEKINAKTDNESEASTITFIDEIEAIRKLASIFSLQAIEDAIITIKNES